MRKDKKAKVKGKLKKGQASIELLGVIGFIFFLLLPLIFISYSKANEISIYSSIEKEKELLTLLSAMIESVSYSPHSNITKTLYFPEYVESITFKNTKFKDKEKGEIVIKDKLGNEIVGLVNAKLKEKPCNIQEGTLQVVVSNNNGEVEVYIKGIC